MSPAEPAPDCAWALETILEGHDRPAGEGAARRLRAHLAACPGCRRTEAAERRLARLLAGAELPPAPADFPHRVKALVRRRRRLRRLSLAGGTAALVAAGVLVAVLCRGSGPDRRAPDAPSAAVGAEEDRFLASAPPVDPLEVLARQQQAYLTALEELQEEPRR